MNFFATMLLFFSTHHLNECVCVHMIELNTQNFHIHTTIVGQIVKNIELNKETEKLKPCLEMQTLSMH